MSFLDVWLPWILVPALVIAILGQLIVQLVMSRAGSCPVRMSGYAVARHILDGSGLYDIQIEQVPGQLSDHFDAQRRVLQLGADVYHGRHIAALARAAHEACHALPDTRRHKWFWVREMAVPAASLGSGGGILIAVLGLICRFPPLLALGIVLFSATVYLQLLSLPIEWHVAGIAQRQLVALGIIQDQPLPRVRRALWAAASARVGDTLQSVVTLGQRLGAWGKQRREGS